MIESSRTVRNALRAKRFGQRAAAAVLAVAALSLAAPGQAMADVKAGVDAWGVGDFDRAVAEWRPLAVAGDPDAQFNMGQAYKFGRGVPSDLNQAEAWYMKAAAQGHLQAEDNLGLVMFANNKRTQAMTYIRKSAARGEPRAQYILGTAHFNGDLAERDFPRAYALTKRASDAGLDVASARLVQLDEMITLDDRQEGLRLAQLMERTEPQARMAAIAAIPPRAVAGTAGASGAPGTAVARQDVPPPSTAPRPVTPPPSSPVAGMPSASSGTIRTTELPPSSAGTTYTPPPVTGSTDPTAPIAPSTPSAPAVVATPTPDQPPAPVPVAKPAPKPAPAAVAQGPRPWRAQLGAFSRDAAARTLWSQLEAKHAAVRSAQPFLEQAGAMTRLQAGFRTQGEALAFCRTVATPGQPCMVIRRN